MFGLDHSSWRKFEDSSPALPSDCFKPANFKMIPFERHATDLSMRKAFINILFE